MSAVSSSSLELAKQSRQLAASGQLEQALKKSLSALDGLSKEKNKNTLYIAYVLDDIAFLYYKLNKLDKAKSFAKRAFQTANKIDSGNKNKPLAIAHIAQNQGAIAYAGGDMELAHQRYQYSYNVYRSRLAEWENAIKVANSLFTLYMDMDRLDEADTLIEENLQRLEKRNNSSLLFDQYVNQIKLGIKSNNTLLIDEAQKNAKVLLSDVNPLSRLTFKELSGRVLIYQSRLPEAKETLQSIIDEALLVNDSVVRDSIHIANAYYYLGFIYIVQGKVIEAEPVVLESLNRFRKIVGSEHPVIGRVLHQLAIINKNIGRLEKSDQYYLRALAIFKKAFGEEHETLGATRLEYSLLLSHQGKFEKAKKQSTSSIELFKKKKSKVLQLGYAHSSLGFVQFDEGTFKESRASFKKAIKLIEKSRGKKSADLPPGLIKLSEIAIHFKQYAKAKRYIDRALMLLESMGAESPYGLIKALSVKADLMNKIGNDKEAKVLGDRYIALLQQRLSIHRNSIVNFALEEQREVRSLFKQYIDVNYPYYQSFNNGYSSSNGTEKNLANILFDDLFIAAQYPHMTGTASAINQMATRISTKGNQKGDQLASLLREREELVTQWAQGQEQSTQQLLGVTKPSTVSSEKAPSIDSLSNKIHELDKELSVKFPPFAELTNPKAVNYKTIQSVLKNDEAFLLQVTEESGTALFYIDKQEVLVKQSPLSRDDLSKRVNRIRHSMDLTRPDIKSYAKMPTYELDDAHYLYQKTLALFETELKNKKHIIAVLDRAMQNIPPAILVTEKPEIKSEVKNTSIDYRKVKFIGHKLAFSIFPAASSLVSLRKLESKSQARKAFIGIGDPDLKQQSSETRSFAFTMDTIAEQIFKYSNPNVLRAIFTPLPETKIELQVLSKTLSSPSNKLILGKEATETKVKSLPLKDYETVSFATHGLLAGEFKGLMEPALVLTPPERSSEVDNGLLMASEIANLELDAEWVLLSACNTAGPNGRLGAEGLSGLAKSFFYAGARSLLVSHWAIDSTSAAFITTRMMEATKNDAVGKAEALQQSMYQLAFENKPYFAHPAFWGAFVIVGDG